MRQIVLVSFVLAAVVAGCSSAPKATPPASASAIGGIAPVTGAPATATQAAPTSRATGASTTGTGAGATGAGATPAGAASADPNAKPVNKTLISQGYKTRTSHGQLLYCRSERVTGSQLSSTRCLTEEQAAIQEQLAKEEMVKRTMGGCMSSTGSGVCVKQ